MRKFKNEKAIKSYSEFADWIKSKNLDYCFENNNTRITIFNPDGRLNDDVISYSTCHPPKSWNVLKNKVKEIIEL